jgi:AraC-like DNA-binding protein
MLRQYHPNIVNAPPLPTAVLVDQIGAMLALVAAAFESVGGSDLKRVNECLRERCTEPSLTAAIVATTLNWPARRVHQALASGGRTFASALLDERCTRALALLKSPSPALPIDEIARRAGFSSPLQLTRSLLLRGNSPRLMSRTRH